MDNSLPPVPDIVRSAYATLIVTSLPEARRFWVDLLGFVVTDADADALYLRGYDELTHHNLILRSGPTAAGRGRARARRGRPGRGPARVPGRLLRVGGAPGAAAAAV